MTTGIELDLRRPASWEPEALDSAIALRVARPMEDYLRRRLRELTTEHLHETGAGRTWSIRLLHTVVDGAEDLRRRELRRLQLDLDRALDRVFVADDLARGDPFGTAGYERVLAAAGAATEESRPASDRTEAVIALEAQLHTADLQAHQPVTGLPFRGRRTERVRARLATAIDAWVEAHVAARVEASVRAVRSRLADELGRRIEDRRRQRRHYGLTYLQQAAAGMGPVTRRATYAGQSLAEPHPGARLPLKGAEWDVLARELLPEPAALLATFARETGAGPDAALVQALVHAPAAEVRWRYEDWLRARVEREVTPEGGLDRMLAVLSEPERNQRIRSLARRGSSLRGRPDAPLEFDRVAAVPRTMDPALRTLFLNQDAVHVDEFVDDGPPDRIEVVTVSCARLSASEIISAGDARLLADRQEDVARELPTAQVRELVRRHGMFDAISPQREDGPSSAM
jgi:hypothetical protein